AWSGLPMADGGGVVMCCQGRAPLTSKPLVGPAVVEFAVIAAVVALDGAGVTRVHRRPNNCDACNRANEPDIFVNYRKTDTRFGAAATYELLAGRFGQERIFLDNQSIRPGAVYSRQLREALESMRVLLVLIGPRWLAVDPRSPGGGQLIQRENDWVRREIRRAIGRAVPIIPVLLDGARMPDPDLLPSDIRRLVLHQFVEIRHRSLGTDVRRLAEHLCEMLPGGCRPGTAGVASRMKGP
ncbi:MAG: toll/interleukin-1 receptor domain-containing protein, partial [Gammaproteobacteria bacterium]